MRTHGVELPRRMARDGVYHRGHLVILDVTDQRLRHPSKVARLMQSDVLRYEREQSAEGQPVDFAQSWLCTLDTDPIPALILSKLWNVRPRTKVV